MLCLVLMLYFIVPSIVNMLLFDESSEFDDYFTQF